MPLIDVERLVATNCCHDDEAGGVDGAGRARRYTRRPRAGFPDRPITIIVPYPGRRAGRHHGTADRAIGRRQARPADRGRQPRRRRGRDRQRRGAARRAGRPYADARHQPDACHQPEPAEELPLRRGEGFRAGRGHRRDSACAGGAARARSGERRRSRGAGEEIAGRTELCFDRRRLRLASRRRIVQDQGRRRASAHSVPRRSADDHRAAGRPCRRHLCDAAERHQHIDAGVIRALAVASGRRAARLPNVPTLAEAGLAGVEADAWFALFAPAKTPAATVERLHRTIVGRPRQPKPPGTPSPSRA